MNTYGWNNYNYNHIYDWQQLAAKQNEQIKQLENRINELEQQIQGKTGTSIDRIEYHFDQLKIEHLEGTLHIGLSPKDLENIDELGIPTNQTKPKEQVNTNQNQGTIPDHYQNTVLPILYGFINEEGSAIIQSLAKKHNMTINHKLEGDMIHDISGQIPERVLFYDKEAREKHQFANQDEVDHFIIDQVKQEIYRSLERFMIKMNEGKGES